jgi:hypothetical protein
LTITPQRQIAFSFLAWNAVEVAPIARVERETVDNRHRGDENAINWLYAFRYARQSVRRGCGKFFDTEQFAAAYCSRHAVSAPHPNRNKPTPIRQSKTLPVT